MKPEPVAKAYNAIGEGPRWNAAEQRLYWVDFIEKQNIHSWHPATDVASLGAAATLLGAKLPAPWQAGSRT